MLSSLGDDKVNCAMRSPCFPVCGHSCSAGFSLFSSSFGSRWFPSGSYLAVYSDHFIFPFTFHFVRFSEHGWSPTGHGSGNHADLSFPCSYRRCKEDLLCTDPAAQIDAAVAFQSLLTPRSLLSCDGLNVTLNRAIEGTVPFLVLHEEV